MKACDCRDSFHSFLSVQPILGMLCPTILTGWNMSEELEKRQLLCLMKALPGSTQWCLSCLVGFAVFAVEALLLKLQQVLVISLMILFLHPWCSAQRNTHALASQSVIESEASWDCFHRVLIYVPYLWQMSKPHLHGKNLSSLAYATTSYLNEFPDNHKDQNCKCGILQPFPANSIPTVCSSQPHLPAQVWKKEALKARTEDYNDQSLLVCPLCPTDPEMQSCKGDTLLDSFRSFDWRQLT